MQEHIEEDELPDEPIPINRKECMNIDEFLAHDFSKEKAEDLARWRRERRAQRRNTAGVTK
ncbi:MAG: hypothetical protein ABSC13_06240 [Dehalococcoidia bacterium]|jgi:hypothetical protein